MKSLGSFATLGHLWLLLRALAAIAAAWTLIRIRKATHGMSPRLPSWFLSSLDPKDRRLLLWCVGGALALAVVTGFLLPNGNNNDNLLPSTYLSGQHGAMAAYETLLRAGYPIERWERPLAELAATAGPETVVIFAQPFTRETDDIKAVRQIVERGGRVLSTGFWGGYILPGASARHPQGIQLRRVQAGAGGLGPAGRLRRGVDGSGGHMASGQPRQTDSVQLRRPARGGGVRLGQGARRVVGQRDSARKRLAGPRPQSRPAAQFAGAARGPPFLLGRVAARGYSLRLELRSRSGIVNAALRPSGAWRF